MTEQHRPSAEAAAVRLAARRAGGGKPAQAAKIVTAGLSTSMVLGLVAVMGWSSAASTASATGDEVTALPIEMLPAPAPVSPGVAATTPAPVVAAAPVGAAPVAAPVAQPAAQPIAQPAPIVVDIPVPIPAPAVAPAASNTQTKQSG